MTLVDVLRKKALEAMKAKDGLATTILRLAQSEVQALEARLGRPLTDDEAFGALRKLVKSNEETLAHTQGDARAALERENGILLGVLPATLGPDQILELLASVADAVRGAKSDGQATGVAMKHLKASGASVQGNDVTAAVKRMRGV